MDELWNRKKIRGRSQGGTEVPQSSHIYNNISLFDTHPIKG